MGFFWYSYSLVIVFFIWISTTGERNVSTIKYRIILSQAAFIHHLNDLQVKVILVLFMVYFTIMDRLLRCAELYWFLRTLSETVKNNYLDINLFNEFLLILSFLEGLKRSYYIPTLCIRAAPMKCIWNVLKDQTRISDHALLWFGMIAWVESHLAVLKTSLLV